MAAGGLRGERLGRMSSAEWETTMQVLSTRPDQLWRLAQEAPPRWSKRLLDALGDWPLQQVSESDRAELGRLLRSAAACPLEVPIGTLVERIARPSVTLWESPRFNTGGNRFSHQHGHICEPVGSDGISADDLNLAK